MTVKISAADLALLNAGKPVQMSATVSPPPNTLAVVFAQNGATPNWPQNYSYNAKTTYGDTTVAGNGNAACIGVSLTGQWGAFQPSNNNDVVTDCSKQDNVTVSIYPTQAGQKCSVFFLMGGDTPIGPNVQLPNALYGPAEMVENEWNVYTFPKNLVMTTAAGVDESAVIYKGDVQDQTGKAANLFYVDNWGMV